MKMPSPAVVVKSSCAAASILTTANTSMIRPLKWWCLPTSALRPANAFAPWQWKHSRYSVAPDWPVSMCS
ncbi:hypothetical protein D3C81_1955870 [compost metagenome]